MQNPNIVFRGNILRVTSKIDPASNVHVGDDYYAERVMQGQDRDLLGNSVGPMRYAFNLFNVKNGAARVSKQDRLYPTQQDGIKTGIPLVMLERHFRARFTKISDARLIKDEMTHLLNEEAKKANRSLVTAALGATLIGLIGVLAASDNGRTINIQQ